MMWRNKNQLWSTLFQQWINLDIQYNHFVEKFLYYFVFFVSFFTTLHIHFVSISSAKKARVNFRKY